MTNDEYQQVAREQRRQQEAEDARRNSILTNERHQREQRQRQEQASIEATSRNLGRVGAIPFGISVDSAAYRLGQLEGKGDKDRADLFAPSSSKPLGNYRAPLTSLPTWNQGSPARRSRRFIGVITVGFAERIWPFSALRRMGTRLRESRSKGKTVSAFVFGGMAALAANAPEFHSMLALQLTTPAALYGAVFALGAIAGWFVPAITGIVIVSAVYLAGLLVELSVYGAIAFGCLWAIKHFQ